MIQFHEVQSFGDAMLDLVQGAFDGFLIEQGIGYVFRYGQRIEQSTLLEQHADLATNLKQLPLRHAGNILSE